MIKNHISVREDIVKDSEVSMEIDRGIGNGSKDTITVKDHTLTIDSNHTTLMIEGKKGHLSSTNAIQKDSPTIILMHLSTLPCSIAGRAI